MNENEWDLHLCWNPINTYLYCVELCIHDMNASFIDM